MLENKTNCEEKKSCEGKKRKVDRGIVEWKLRMV